MTGCDPRSQNKTIILSNKADLSVCFSYAKIVGGITLKTLKTRLISTLLVVMTLLSLLPTTAFAATGTGKGITITTNQVYWSTRILANGTPYSYRPPEAAGRLLYCLDSGLGYQCRRRCRSQNRCCQQRSWRDGRGDARKCQVAHDLHQRQQSIQYRAALYGGADLYLGPSKL